MLRSLQKEGELSEQKEKKKRKGTRNMRALGKKQNRKASGGGKVKISKCGTWGVRRERQKKKDLKGSLQQRKARELTE